MYSKSLSARIRQALGRRTDIEERRMFGGIGFLLHGNMCVGVWQNSLIVRLGPEIGPAALSEPHVLPFDVTGRPMKGWAMVEAEGLDTDDQLDAWIQRSIEFVATLPAK
jgi:TfoX/Sxy family transcriptional regulator of competence genes